ncbi:death domain-containing membrane protein NRADD-like isoform X2 [Ciconia boyciana]|uniref:death domain-containing membrane protein NRADD-like isoform X2 n=1 Tax=Ciconia boyciana TaxID=52775 RepID=UPI003B9F6F9F
MPSLLFFLPISLSPPSIPLYPPPPGTSTRLPRPPTPPGPSTPVPPPPPPTRDHGDPKPAPPWGGGGGSWSPRPRGQRRGETEAGPPPCPQVPGWGGGWGRGRTAGGGCCTPCPPGFGVTEPCGHADTRCQPCTHIEDLERMEGDPPGEPVTGDPSPATPKFVPPPPEATGKDIIPVYCSLLAAVVVGLLAYVAFKCWHTCRQKQQLAKARAGDLGTSPEGEKLHSDSGVFLDTHSLQEPHQPGKAPRPEGHPLGAVAPQRQEELERLLESGGPGGDWRSLAARLGFGPDAIGTFGRGRAPTRTLLSAWAGTEGATLETLCQALAAIGRQDVAQRLAGPGDATSAV